MALLLKAAYKGYFYLINDLADPRTKDLPMVNSPISAATIVISYLLFVCHFGPKYMKDRKPFNIDTILIIYNAFQVVLCSYLVLNFFPGCWYGNIFCEEVNPRDNKTKVPFTCYIYYLTKITDLWDTVFFVLKKNKRQLTFLHVYHHSLLVAYCWWVVKFYPGGQFTYVGLVNSFVHIVMYGYYLLSVIDKSLQSSKTWKKHITRLQLMQFALYTFLFFLPLLQRSCSMPISVCVITLPQVCILTALFGEFYYKNYICNQEGKKKQEFLECTKAG